MKDDRFGVIYDFYYYNIDFLVFEYKKIKFMEVIIEEKLYWRKLGIIVKVGGVSG